LSDLIVRWFALIGQVCGNDAVICLVYGLVLSLIIVVSMSLSAVSCQQSYIVAMVNSSIVGQAPVPNIY